jgi:CheY-like chemotaxis protein
METEKVLSAYYRLRLEDALRNRLELTANQVRRDASTVKQVIFSDVLTLENIRNQRVPAADPGEMKHPALDRKSLGDTIENSINVRQLEQAAGTASTDYAYRYQTQGKISSTDFRRRMEDRVRRSKRAGLECPFKDDKGQCTMLFIRCGDRLQFSQRETGSERRFFHKCTYDWRNRGDHVLIVDDDRNMRDFCKSTFALFMHYDEAKITTAGSVDEAIDVLARSKVDGKRYSLIITDILMPDRTGYDLVNELYARNFEVEIVLMKEEHEMVGQPADYKGDAEVLPNRPFVSGILIKPFHSEKLILEVKKLRFGWER